MTDAIRELFELLTKREKSGSDYTGRVTRVDGKTAYVQFDGSDITDTPVALSIGAKAGDSVRVRVADGRAWLVGNDDAPPNDSSEVGYELALTNALIRQLTTEQINGENGWINLLKGTFNYGNRLIWNGSILSLIGKIETSEGKVAGWVIGASTISSGAKGANTALVTLKSGASGSITVENIYFKSLLDYNGLAMTGDYGETQLTNTGFDIRRKYIGDTTWVHTYITGGTVQVGDSPNQTIIGEGTGDFTGAVTAGGSIKCERATSSSVVSADVMAKSTTTGCQVGLSVNNNGQTGIWSNGYWNGNRFVSGGLWLLSRETDGRTKITSYSGTYSYPIVSYSTVVGNRVGGFICNSATQLSIYGDWKATDGTAKYMYVTVSSSDPRLKENIAPAQMVALDLIDKIQLHEFDWKTDAKHWDVGFIAPELLSIDPNLVIVPENEDEGYYGVDDFYLTGIQTKAIQELHAKVKSLKAEIAELKEIIAVLMEGKK